MPVFPDHVWAFLRDVVGPAVSPAGFELTRNGGYKDADGSLEVLFEADPAEFGPSYPSLMPNYGDDDPGCIDLWIRYHGTSRTIEAELEGSDVAAWLRRHGHEPLATAMAAPLDLQPAVDALARGLQVMLASARSTR